MKTMRPEACVVPIVVSTETHKISELLGTGFFIQLSSGIGLMSARHVFDKRPLNDGEKYAYVFKSGDQIQIWALNKIIASDKFDIAITPEIELKDALALPIAQSGPALNDEILSYEYSYSQISLDPAGGDAVTFTPLCHKGNVVSYFESTYPEKVPTPSLLTSFPAFQGASGAPIIWVNRTQKEFSIAGMIVGNLETEMMPAQTVKIQDGDSYSEETRYFHSYGKGIQRKVLSDFIASIGT